MAKIFWPNGELPSATNRFASGASSSDLRSPVDCGADIRGSEIRSTSMRSVSGLGVSSGICGAPLTRMATSSTCIFRTGGMPSRRSDFFCRLVRCYGTQPWKVIADKLCSYRAAHRELVPDSLHVTDRYANSRVEQSHEATRFRERGMRRFKSDIQAQRFLDVHAAIYNVFNVGRHLVRACHYRMFRDRAFASWKSAVQI